MCREEWHEHQHMAVHRAQTDTMGNLVRRDRSREFARVFGNTWGGYCRWFRSSRKVRERYATPELLEWWARNGHTTFEQWALAAGFRRKFLLAARRAGRA